MRRIYITIIFFEEMTTIDCDINLITVQYTIGFENNFVSSKHVFRFSVTDIDPLRVTIIIYMNS